MDILELPSVRQMIPLISVAEYHRTPEFNVSGRRTELIRGIVIEKVSKAPRHVALLRRLFQIVQAAVGEGRLVYKEDPLTLADSEPEPDISVVAGSEGDYDDTHPTSAQLVIEVAITTVELDRAKVSIYAEANVPECWLVLGNENAVEVYTQPQGGVYLQRRLYSQTETVISVTMPALRVDLTTMFED